MTEWPTLEEIIAKPIKISRQDPVYHNQQLPVFMKRRSLLPERYEKPFYKKKLNHRSYEIPKKKVKRSNPSQSIYEAYGRIFRHQSQSSPRSQKNPNVNYDEAINNQLIFTNTTPADCSKPGEYKFSLFPSVNLKQTENSEQAEPLPVNKSFQRPANSIKNTKKATKIVDNELSSIIREKINVLLIRNSPKKCNDCGFVKCQCAIEDEGIPQNVLENLNKGRNLISEYKALKKIKKQKRHTGIIRKKKIKIDEDLMRYTMPNLKIPAESSFS